MFKYAFYYSITTLYKILGKKYIIINYCCITFSKKLLLYKKYVNQFN